MPAGRQYNCTRCHLPFTSTSQYYIHRRAMHPKCSLCGKRFDSLEQLQCHQRQTGHLFCSECHLHFPKIKVLIQHVRAVQHAEQYHCCECDRDYNSQRSLDNHCCDCDRVFTTSGGLNCHIKKRAHVPRAKDVQVQAKELGRPKCKECDKDFPTKKALKKHKSKLHPKRRIPCLASIECAKMFITPSGLLSHLESGRCRSGMTREKMHELVVAHDESRHITDARAGEVVSSVPHESPKYSSPLSLATDATDATDKISQFSHTGSPSVLTNPTPLDLVLDKLNLRIHNDRSSVLDEVPLQRTPSDIGSEWSVLDGAPIQPLTPEHSSEWSLVSPIRTPAVSHFSDAEPDGISEANLRCPRCPPNKKPFRSLLALNGHISSAAHAPKIFHCPMIFALDIPPTGKQKKEKRFATLAGLAHHLESGACQGGKTTFVNAMEYVQDRLASLGFADVKLLLD